MKFLLSLPMTLLVSTLALAQDEVPAAVEGAKHVAEAHEENPSLFAGTLYQTAATLIVLIALYIILSKYAWGPILKGLQDREHKIKSDLEAAEKANKEAAAILEDYKKKLAQAQNDAARIIAEARKEAETAAAKIQVDAKTEIELSKNRALSEVKFAKEQAVSELYAQTATLATHVASKILKREVTAADQSQLVSDSLAEIKQGSLN